MTSCSSSAPQEKKFGVAVCRERKCPDLQKDPKWPDSPQQCQITHGMPGAMHCCIKEMDAEHFLRQVSGQLNNSPYTAQRPGVRNCPKECPYKIFVDGEKFVFEKGKPESSKIPAKIGTCVLIGKPLGECGVCPCNVLGNKFQESQILQIKGAIERCQKVSRDAFESGHACSGNSCPDGIQRCDIGDKPVCPLIRVPFADLKECPLWRIPAKTLAGTDTKVSGIPVSRSEKPAQNDSIIPLSQGMTALVDAEDYNRLSQFKWSAKMRHPNSSVYYAVRKDLNGSQVQMHRMIMNAPVGMEIDHINGNGLDNRKKNLRIVTTRQNSQNRHGQKASSYPGVTLKADRKINKWQARIWEGDKAIFLGNFATEELASAAYQKAVSLLDEGKDPSPEKLHKDKPEPPALNTLYFEDNEALTKRMAPKSIDVIFTDPSYGKEPVINEVEQWERAYAALNRIAGKVLKPSGFLFTYAPQAHLLDIMEILAYGSSFQIMCPTKGCALDFFWIIPSLNLSQSTAKDHKHNAICLHKPILVYQKPPFKSPSRCFADVVRGKRQKAYHPFQQSIHDVLGIISRFMEPGQVLYDPYAGTGTSLKAAKLLGLQWIGCEIDPETHAIAVRELQQEPITLFSFDEGDNANERKGDD